MRGCLGLIFFLCQFFLLVSTVTAQDCTNPDDVLGATVFNYTHGVFQGCTQAGWQAFHLPVCPDGDECGYTPAPSGCTLDGETVVHGASYTFYSAEEDADCASISQSRTCTDGTFDGSGAYQYASCSAPAADCTLDGQTVNHGTSYTFYSAEEDADCASISQSRTCTDGTLDGDSAYEFSNCSNQDITPDAFSFADQTDVALNTAIESNSLNITGITGSVSVSISGDGSPQFRIAGGSWTSGPATIMNGQSLQLRLTSSVSNGTMRSATVTVGTESDQWDVTTINAAPGSQEFTSPGSSSFTVPAYGTLTVEVWGGGGGGSGAGGLYLCQSAGGASGESSSFGSITANGGIGANSSSGGDGGTASGGDTNMTGQTGCNSGANGCGGNAAGPSGGGGAPPNTSSGTHGQNGSAPGGGGSSGRAGFTCVHGGGGGGGGGYATKTYAPGDLTVGGSVPVTVGDGGSGGSYTANGGDGGPGKVSVSWN